MIYIPLERAFQDESIDICHVKNKVGPKSFMPQRRAPNGVKMTLYREERGYQYKKCPFRDSEREMNLVYIIDGTKYKNYPEIVTMSWQKMTFSQVPQLDEGEGGI